MRDMPVGNITGILSPSAEPTLTTATTVGAPTYTNTWPNATVSQFATWPSYCGVNLHVWACDHQTACKCGSVSRAIKKPVCTVCGS